MRILPVYFSMILVACQAPTEHPEKDVKPEESATYTKTMEYAVDLNSVFHEDLTDEDFSDVNPISEQLISDVLDGKLQAFDRFSDEPLDTEHVRSLLQYTDTVWTQEPETGDERMHIIERDLTQEFHGFTFREQWTYDADGHALNRKVVAVAPRIPVYSKQGGELRGYTSAFWVKYE